VTFLTKFGDDPRLSLVRLTFRMSSPEYLVRNHNLQFRKTVDCKQEKIFFQGTLALMKRWDERPKSPVQHGCLLMIK